MPDFSLNEIIELAVQIEHNGYAFYNEAIKHKDLDNKSLELLTLLRDQELVHEKTFLGLRDDEDLKQITLTQDWEMVASYLKTITDSRIFNTEDAAIRLASESKEVLDIINYAIQFEKDTLLFFHTVKDTITGPKAQGAVARIIHEEISHVLKLNDYRAALKQN
jgi:rubrerythrin